MRAKIASDLEDDLLRPRPLPPDDERCEFQARTLRTGKVVGGDPYYMARCLIERGHDTDHVLPAGGCVVGVRRAVPLYRPAPPANPLPGDGELCRHCGLASGGVMRTSPRGDRLRCTRHPECTYTLRPGQAPWDPLVGQGDPCPSCASRDRGVLQTRSGRFGRYLRCTRFPDCGYLRREDGRVAGAGPSRG
jgi:hypothetical protein